MKATVHAFDGAVLTFKDVTEVRAVPRADLGQAGMLVEDEMDSRSGRARKVLWIGADVLVTEISHADDVDPRP